MRRVAIIIAVAFVATLPTGCLMAARADVPSEALGRLLGVSLIPAAAGLISLHLSTRKGQPRLRRAILWTLGFAMLANLTLVKTAVDVLGSERGGQLRSRP